MGFSGTTALDVSKNPVRFWWFSRKRPKCKQALRGTGEPVSTRGVVEDPLLKSKILYLAPPQLPLPFDSIRPVKPASGMPTVPTRRRSSDCRPALRARMEVVCILVQDGVTRILPHGAWRKGRWTHRRSRERYLPSGPESDLAASLPVAIVPVCFRPPGPEPRPPHSGPFKRPTRMFQGVILVHNRNPQPTASPLCRRRWRSFVFWHRTGKAE